MYWQQNAQALQSSQQADLVQRLAQTTATTRVQLAETATGDYTLAYQGVYLHHTQGATLEAKQIIAQHCRAALGRAHLILGIGLGYLLEATYQHSPGQIVIYESDLPLLKFVLDNVDLSEYLGSGRVSLTTTTSETLNALHPHVATEDPLDILVTPGYVSLLHQEIPDLMAILLQMVEERIRDFKTGQHFHQQWTRQFFQNLPYFSQTLPFSEISAAYQGKPALIIGRGPSLDAAISELQTLSDSMVLIAAGSALHRLYQANITPDFTVFYDANGMKAQLHGLPDSYLQAITFLISPFTESVCFQAPSRAKVLCYPQNGEAFAEWLKAAIPNNPSLASPLVLEGGGTVSLIAMQMAQALQSSHIILIGQDLAFPNNQVYAGGIAVQQDEQGRLALSQQADLYTAPEAMTVVKGQNNQDLPALKAYAGFIRHFERLAEENAKATKPALLYNASLGGAAIEGYTLQPLSTFQSQFSAFKPLAGHAQVALWKTPSELSKEPLRLALSKLKQDMQYAIELHAATMPGNLTLTNHSADTRQQLFEFLNQHPLISHFLMFEMMNTQQRYNPKATTNEAITANLQLLQQGTRNCIEILQSQILPILIQTEIELLPHTSTSPSVCQAQF